MSPENRQIHRKVWAVIGSVILAVVVIAAAVVAIVMNNSNTNGSDKSKGSAAPSAPSVMQGALGANQRDAARKTDASQVMAALNAYRANNKGNLPSPAALAGTSFTEGDYLSSSDMSREITVDSTNDTPDRINVHLQKTCDGTVAVRRVSVSIQLEASLSRYCIDD